MLLEVIWVRRAGPVHEVEVDIVSLEVGKRPLDALGHALMPRVVELGGEEYFLARDAGSLDTIANLLLVAVCKGRVNMTVAVAQGGFNGRLYFVGLGLPGAQANSGDLGARVEGECFAVQLSRGLAMRQ